MATPPAPSADHILAVLSAAAKEAGQYFAARRGVTAVEATKASDVDLVTAVDKKCQEIIQDAVRTHLPGFAMLGEEDVSPGSAASAAALAAAVAATQAASGGAEYLVIVDPLDGTANFVHGLPLSAVSIGVAHRGELLVGIIYIPYFDEMYTAIRGRGAFLNDKPLHVASETNARKGMYGFGTHHTPHVCKTMLRGLEAVTRRVRAVRSVGSAAVHLAWVAAGRLTGFWELDLSSWDVSAGALLVAEAGGRVSDTRGEPYTIYTRDLLASGGQGDVHTAVLEALAEAGAAVPDAKEA